MHGTTPPVVFVVEDETLLRDTIVVYRRDCGCTVLEAPSGEGAVAWLNTHQPIDVVFTGIRLGGSLNGWDVGAQFRAARADVAVIYTSRKLVEPPRHVAGSLFFDKPYHLPAILDARNRLAGRTTSAGIAGQARRHA